MTEPKFKTLAFDSAGELARLAFSFDMKKHSSLDVKKEQIRQVNNYPGSTERLNMIIRRLRNFRDAGMEIVFTAHEDVERFFAKKSSDITGKEEPYATKGWCDLPGKRTPDEVGRVLDNYFHVRRVNKVVQWVAIEEMLAPSTPWSIKDRFNAPAINNGFLPASYAELAKLAKANPLCNWKPPYIWMLYGAIGMNKTRSLITFPPPILVFDFDRGTTSITDKEKEACQMTVKQYDTEESDDYNCFLGDLEACMP